MQNIRIAFTLVLLLSLFNVYGQADTKKPPMFRLYTLGATPDYQLMQKSWAGMEGYRHMAPHSDILSKDLSGYKIERSSQSTYTGLELLAEFAIRNINSPTYNKRLFWQVGLGYSLGSNFGQAFEFIDSIRIDTSQSLMTGNQNFTDSISFEYFNGNFSSDQIRLHLSVAYRFVDVWKLSLYIGGGGYVGYSVDNSFDLYYSQRSSYMYTGPDYDWPNYREASDSELRESVRYPSRFGGGAFVFFREKFTFGPHHRHECYAETRVGKDFVELPYYGSKGRPFFHLSIGYRIYLKRT